MSFPGTNSSGFVPGGWGSQPTDDASPASGGSPAFQMLWDCKYCGTNKLLGVDQRFCPNCGAAQEPAMRYFPSDEDKKIVSDPKYVYAGADRMCPACQTPNSAAANFCKQCGSDLSGAKEAERKSESADNVGKADDLVKLNFNAEMLRVGVTKPAASGQKYLPIILIVVGLLVAGLAGVFFLSRSTYDAKLQVSDMRWTRTISLVKVTVQSGSGWRDQVPGGAYSMSCSNRQRQFTRSESYRCGVTRVDRGDGSFVEQPKYCTRNVTDTRTDSYCSYLVDVLVPSRDVTTTGGVNDPPVWGTFTLATRERENARAEEYKVIFKGLEAKKDQLIDFLAKDYAQFKTFALNSVYTLKFNRLEQPQWDTLKLTPQ